MKPIAIITMIIGSLLMLLFLLSCGAALYGFGQGYQQSCSQYHNC